jgi:putative ABC transport system substrate-binding protein
MLQRPALILALGCAVAAGAADRPKVAVVKSAELGPYAQVVAGFTAEVRGEAQEFTLEEGAEGAARTWKKVAAAGPKLVLAIGPAAAVGARQKFTDVPVLFSMVPYFQKYELEGANSTGIALSSDLTLELSALRALLPQARRVGVLEDPRYSQPLIDGASQAATARGLTLTALELDSPQKVDRVLAGARGRLDALLVIADKTVGNAAVVETLLAFAAAEKLPVVGLAPAQVKQGALLALSPSPLGIGLQAGRLANRVLVEHIDPGALAVAPPEGVELHLNLSTAKKLQLPERFALEVITFAARQGLTVRVVE